MSNEKIPLEEIDSMIYSHVAAGDIPNAAADKLMADFKKLIKEMEADKEDKEPRKKAQYVIVASPEDVEKYSLDKLELFVVKTNEEYDHSVIGQNIFSAAVTFNTSDKKAKKHPIKGLSDAAATLKKKHFDVTPETDIPKFLSKQPLIVIAAELPKADHRNVKADEETDEE